MNQEIVALLKAALECSIYVSPRDPGLTYQELAEIAKRAGYLEGEINDALHHAGDAFFGRPRVMLSEQDMVQWVFFFPEDPDYKDYAALDLVYEELNLRLSSEGEARAQIERSVLVERAAAKSVPRQNMEVAITWPVMAKQLAEKDNIVRFAHRGSNVRQLPSVTRGMHRHKEFQAKSSARLSARERHYRAPRRWPPPACRASRCLRRRTRRARLSAVSNVVDANRLGTQVEQS